MVTGQFEGNLEKYAQVIVKVGLNLQPGQRLMIGAPFFGIDGTPIEAYQLVRQIVKYAYQAGAESGQEALDNLLDTDEASRRLGEVALVPNSSPISQSGLLFYNILFDENASNHLALGNAYRFSMEGGEAITAEEFAAAGGNESMTHADFMIGSGEMDVDGMTEDGTAEPVMRAGEWAFEV